MPALRRLEIWSDLQCRGGASLAAVPDILALVETTKVAGDSTLQLTLPVQSPAYAQLLERRVLRVVYVDDTFDEWRILTMEEASDPQRGLVTVVTAGSIMVDLANALCYRVEANGASYPDFEGLQLTPAQHINSFVIPSLVAAGQTFWASGQVDPSVPIDMVYSWDTPLSAMKRLAQTALTTSNPQVEFAVRRNGVTGYFIDLVNQIGAGATSVDVRLGKNIRAIKRLRDTVDIATRVYPRGAAVGNIHPSLAGAKWKVVASAGNVLTLADPVNVAGAGPIQYDNQLNGYYVVSPTGQLFLVTASVAGLSQHRSNPGFESGLPFWNIQVGGGGNGVIITDTTRAHSGSKYLQLTSATGFFMEAQAVDSAGAQEFLQVAQGDVISFGGWCYRESGTAVVHWILECRDAAFGIVEYAVTPGHGVPAWVLEEGLYRVPAGIKYVTLYGEVNNAGVATVARFDDAYVYGSSVLGGQKVTLSGAPSVSAAAHWRTMPQGEKDAWRPTPAQPIVSQPTTLLLSKSNIFTVRPRPQLDTLVPSFYEPPLLPDSLGLVKWGDLVEFRLDALGDEVLYLDSPVQKAAYGVKPVVYDRPDIPGTRNLIPNPAMRVWTGGAAVAPDNWTKLGNPTLTQTSTPGLWRVGTQSCKVVSFANGDGLETVYAPVTATLPKPYFSGFVSFFMTGGGQVRVELWATDGTTTYVFPDGTSGKAFSTQLNAWVDLGVAGIDLNKLGATFIKMRVVQDGSQPCVFYVDGAQVVNEAAQLPFFEGYGPTVLWQAANAYLSNHDAPLVTVTVDIVDLTRENPTAWPYDNLTLGGPVVITDSLLNLSVSTRVVEIKRNLLVDADSGVVLSNRPEDLTDALIRPRLAQRFDRPVVAPLVPRVDAYFATQVNAPTQLQIRLVGTPAGASVKYLVQDAAAVPPLIGASGFLPYTGAFLMDLTALTTDQTLYAYAQQGNIFSNLSTWRLAAKGLPSATPTLSENPGGTLNMSWSVDVTTAFVLLFRGKNLGGNHWPTQDNTATGRLDQTQFYARVAIEADGGGWNATGGPINGGLSLSEAGYANGNTAYVIVIPFDRWGNAGPRGFANITMTGAATPGIASTDTTATTHAGADCPNSDFDIISFGCTLNASTLSGDTVLVEYKLNSGAYVTVTTFTLTGPSQHVSSTLSTGKVSCPGLPHANNGYTFRYTLKRSGVQQDQLTGNTLQINERTDCAAC